MAATRVRREQAFFDGSRLYRQAAEGAALLLTRFTETAEPFGEELVRATGGARSVEVKDVEDCNSLIAALESHVRARAAHVSPFLGVPVLAEATSRFYYERPGDEHDFAPWLGTAFKVCLAYVWPHLHGSPGTSGATRDLAAAVAAAGLVDQVRTLRLLFTLAEGRATIDGTGIFVNDQLREPERALTMTFRDRGRALRLAKATTEMFLLKRAEMFVGLARVLGGEAPSTIEEFGGTIFSAIPGGEDPAFWAGLAARLALFEAVLRVRGTVSHDPTGIAVIGHMGIGMRGFGASVGPAVQKAAIQAFWSESWHAAQESDRYHSLIVDRPLIRIRATEDLFVTSAMLIGDSINWFVETSFMEYAGASGVPLSSECFQRVVSEPFEREITEVFRSEGFVAGRVSESGAWSTQNGVVDLAARGAAGPPPGEIDCLAVHESAGAVVGECKVLNLPFTGPRLRNVVGKLGEKDDEGFRTKLRSKVSWVEAVGRSGVPKFTRPYAMLILDRMLPGLDVGRRWRSSRPRSFAIPCSILRDRERQPSEVRAR